MGCVGWLVVGGCLVDGVAGKPPGTLLAIDE